MNAKPAHAALSLVAACLILSACTTDPGGDFSSDGSPGFMNQEINTMGQAMGPGTFKLAADDESETILTALAYDSICQCFVRGSGFTFTTPKGKTFTRERRDSIWLADSSGAFLHTYSPFQAATITHHRRVVKVNGAMDVDLLIKTVLTWVVDENGDRTAILANGTVTGTYDGVPFQNGGVAGLKRAYTFPNIFGLPDSGLVTFTHKDYTYDLTFLGEGKAEADIKGKGKSHKLDVNGGKETRKGKKK